VKITGGTSIPGSALALILALIFEVTEILNYSYYLLIHT
jgi:hypothetical protein